ncbi:phospholipase [Bacteroidia bacterium]|nr:phospholipase [Bacteroidia bacterium]
MNRVIVTLILAASCLMTQAQENNAKNADFSLFQAKERQKDGYTLPYRILYPENMKPGKKYPLFLFLHGLGKRGTDNRSQLDRGAHLFVNEENRSQYPCIAIYPQVPEGPTGSFFYVYDGGEQTVGTFASYSKIEDKSKVTIKISPYGAMVMDILRELIDRGVADPKRIYISGASMGGFSTFQFISAYPDMFAAAAPIASSMNPKDIGPWFGKVPIWILHGDKDRQPTLDANKVIVDKLKASGYSDYRYTLYKNTGHNSWDKAFAEPEYMKWFFEHTRK